jgi:hypothetical protein
MINLENLKAAIRKGYLNRKSKRSKAPILILLYQMKPLNIQNRLSLKTDLTIIDHHYLKNMPTETLKITIRNQL